MISIIVSSYKSDLFAQFSQNVADTIGCPYEIIKIHNPGLMGICEAYNKGTMQAKYPYFCYVHEDVIFETHNWGKILINIFENDSDIGLIGMAGTKLLSKAPTTWWDNGESNNVLYLNQSDKNANTEFWNKGFAKKDIIKVAAIDGVFMATKKSVNLWFNEDVFKNFHGYDLNASIEVIKKGYNVIVTNKILLTHYSHGTISNEWYEAIAKLYLLYLNFLPININGILEIKPKVVYERFILDLLDRGYIKIAIECWTYFIYYHPLSKAHFLIFKKLISKNFHARNSYSLL